MHICISKYKQRQLPNQIISQCPVWRMSCDVSHVIYPKFKCKSGFKCRMVYTRSNLYLHCTCGVGLYRNSTGEIIHDVILVPACRFWIICQLYKLNKWYSNGEGTYKSYGYGQQRRWGLTFVVLELTCITCKPSVSDTLQVQVSLNVIIRHCLHLNLLKYIENISNDKFGCPER